MQTSKIILSIWLLVCLAGLKAHAQSSDYALTASTAINGNYTVSWNSAYSDTGHFLLENAGAGWQVVDTEGVASYSVLGREPGDYRYKLAKWAIIPTGNAVLPVYGFQSDVLTVAVLPEIPRLAYAETQDGQSQLVWQAVNGADTYVLERRSASSAWEEAYTGSELSWVSSDINDGDEFRIRACTTEAGGNLRCGYFSETESTSEGSIALSPIPAAKPSVEYGNDLVGALAGKHSVNGAGAATYSIPLKVATGTAGVVPSASLEYSSQGGYGPMGKGWSIAGTSVISRCRKTLQIDGAVAPIRFSETDRFCLNGNRLLIDHLSPAAYGEIGAIYRTEIDQFVKVVAMGGAVGEPDYFEVTAKDGSTKYYGRTENSRRRGMSTDATETPSAVMSWYIDESVDSVGNPIKYHYHNVPHGIGVERIYYAFGANVGASASMTYLEFNYATEPRPAGRRNYVAGYEFRDALKLDSVSSYSEYQGASQLLRHYRLNYNPVDTETIDERRRNKHENLVGVQECTDLVGMHCKNETRFEWGRYRNLTGPLGNVKATTGPLIGGEQAMGGHIFLDINGDGLKDIIYELLIPLSNGGKNRSKLHYMIATPSGAYVVQHFGAHGGLSPGEDCGTTQLPICYRSNSDSLQNRILAIDYNADGRNEIMYFVDNRWLLFKSIPLADGRWQLRFDRVLPFVSRGISLADINSDGLTDVVDAGANYIDTYLLQRKENITTLSDAYHFVRQPRKSMEIVQDSIGRHPHLLNSTVPVALRAIERTPSSLYRRGFLGLNAFDYNGDGKTDYAGIYQYFYKYSLFDDTYEYCEYGSCDINNMYKHQWNSYFVLYEENESGDLEIAWHMPLDRFLDTEHNGLLYDGYDKRPAGSLFAAADINADGLSDYIIKHYGEWRLYMNNGIAEPQQNPITIGGLHGKAPRFADINYDGFQDIYFTIDAYRVTGVRHWDPQTQRFSPLRTLGSADYDRNPWTLYYTDMDGDGALDEVSVASGPYGFFNVREPFQLPDRHMHIDKIVNGLGGEINLEYGTLSRTDHYSRVEGITNGASETYQQCSLNPVYSPSRFGRDESRWRFVCNDVVVRYGNATEFYAELLDPLGVSDANYFGLGAKFQSPIVELFAPVHVVKRVSSTAPVSNPDTPGQIDTTAESAISYFYEKAKIQAGGRGILGFQFLTRLDEQTGTLTKTQYRQDFPFIGAPVTTETFTPDGQRISRSENIYGLKSRALGEFGSDWDASADTAQGLSVLGSLQPYVRQSIETRWHNYSYLDTASTGSLQFGVDENVILARQVVDNEYDIEGNLRHSVASSYEGANQLKYRVTTDNIYGSDAYHRENGRLTSTVVRHHRPGDQTASGLSSPDQVRELAYEYYASGPSRGLLRTEIVEPNKPNLRKQTTFEYDAFGNKQRTTVSAQGLVSRSSRVEYDAAGRYVERTYNAKEQLLESVEARNIYGSPSRVRDINGVLAETDYTPFGKVFLQYSPSGSYTHKEYLSCTSGLVVCPSAAVYAERISKAGGATSIEYFDVVARSIRTESVGFDGRILRIDTEYDSANRVARKSKPYYIDEPVYWVNSFYDPLGRAVYRTEDTVDLPIEHFFGVNGLRKSVATWVANPTAVNDSHRERFEYTNILDETVLVRDALGGTVEYEYDDAGNMLSITSNASVIGGTADGSSESKTIVYRYDDLGRKVYSDDPDRGVSHQDYNAFGELIYDIDANGNYHVYEYDILGRLVLRDDYRPGNELEERTEWFFDTPQVGPGKLDYVAQLNSGYIKFHSYDSLGRNDLTTTSTGAGSNDVTFSESVTYDNYGRVFQKFDASGGNNGVEYVYNDYGYLLEAKEAASVGGQQQLYYQIRALSNRGKVAEVLWGNGFTTYRDYDLANGTPLNIETSNGIDTAHHLNVKFDDFGNVVFKRNLVNGVYESFEYDELDRLQLVRQDGIVSQEMIYDSFGNLKSKSDVGGYEYGEEYGPNTLRQIGNGASYEYDAVGNLNSDSTGRLIRYSSFNKAVSISNASGDEVQFAYGPNRSRYQRMDMRNGQLVSTKTYMGTVERVDNVDGSHKYIRYIDGYAIVVQQQHAPDTIQYIIKDHLGSTELLLEHDVLAAGAGFGTAMSFDAWGKQRSVDQYIQLSTIEVVALYASSSTDRGYTGHEMLARFGLIHMNGRLYDPELARFIQVDPLIDGLYNTQAYARYSYVSNNPLRYVDPSGYSKWSQYRDEILKPLISISVGIVCAPCAVALTVVNAQMETGSWGAALEAGVIAGITAGAFHAVGELFGGNLGSLAEGTAEHMAAHVAAHALVGGVLAEIQGGNFWTGFLSAGVAKFATLSTQGIGQGRFDVGDFNVAAFMITTVVGGTTSALTGGKFANGAILAAYAYVFNHHHSKRRAAQKERRSQLDFKKMVAGLKKLQDKGSTKVFLDAGFTQDEIYKFKLANACSCRLSIAMNGAGGLISSGWGFRPNGDNLITGVNEMAEYMTTTYGNPDIVWSGSTFDSLSTQIGNQQGILLFTSSSGAASTNHATAWESGATSSIDGYGSVSHDLVRFWAFP